MRIAIVRQEWESIRTFELQRFTSVYSWQCILCAGDTQQDIFTANLPDDHPLTVKIVSKLIAYRLTK